MDIEKVLLARENRKSRINKPFQNYLRFEKSCLEAGESLLIEHDYPHRTLLERSIVISFVSAIEVYFKDMLDLVFKYCDPAWFRKHLKSIHPNKYTISDLVDMYEQSIHPLELISFGQSFQNSDQIETVFSKLNGKPFWSSVLGLRARVKDRPETEVGWSHEQLDSLKYVFKLRHELVHDPTMKEYFDSSLMENLRRASQLMLGVDISILSILQEHKDPELDE
ncbi:MAG: hypothetical protein HQ556_04290 [Candidatus Marinimicrobia bacterium]|nr:hypothetical protein [Candidatus Neomarinimicrobiota bacterium]